MTRIDPLIDWFEKKKPDELFKELLVILWGRGPIVFGVVLVLFVSSWLGALKKASKAGRGFKALWQELLKNARSLPAGEKTYRTITSLARIMLQAVWIWSVYTVGNAVNNLAAFTAPGAKIIWNEDGSLHDQVFQPTQWNTTTSTITTLGIGALAAFYWKAVKWYGWADAVAKFAAWILASPGLVCTVICGVLVLQGAFAGPWHSMYLTALIIALLYTIFCFLIPGSVQRLMRTWPLAPQSPGAQTPGGGSGGLERQS